MSSQYHKTRQGGSRILKQKPIDQTIQIPDMNDRVEVTNPHFRGTTELPRMKLSFAFNSGGIGDYIHWTPAIRWAIENHVHISGYVIAPSFFAPLAELWLGSVTDRYEIYECDDLSVDPFMKTTPMRIPNADVIVNACGWSMFSLGWMYYANIDYIPKGYNQIPVIRGDEADLAKFNLPEKYAVLTTAATTKLRTIPTATINGILTGIKERGFTPVLLGKADMMKNYTSSSPEGIDLDGVIDLREKTGLVEAACILAGAKFATGLDNGLLHLACCSKTPVIIAFTTVHPRFRIPPRQEGTKTMTIIPDETLKCRFCQTNMRYILSHNFNNCLYQDELCCKLMVAEPFLKAIDEVLK